MTIKVVVGLFDYQFDLLLDDSFIFKKVRKLKMSHLKSHRIAIREFESPRYPDIEKPKVFKNSNFWPISKG